MDGRTGSLYTFLLVGVGIEGYGYALVGGDGKT